MITGRGMLYFGTPNGEVREVGPVESLEWKPVENPLFDEEDCFPEGDLYYPYKREALRTLVLDGQVTQDLQTNQVRDDVVLVIGSRHAGRTASEKMVKRIAELIGPPVQCRSTAEVLDDFRRAHDLLRKSCNRTQLTLHEFDQATLNYLAAQPQQLVPDRKMTRGQKAWQRKRRGW